MFKQISLGEQLRNATSELTKLKSTVGELPIVEVVEGSEEIKQIKQPQLVDRAEQNRADIDYLAIMAEVEL